MFPVKIEFWQLTATQTFFIGKKQKMLPVYINTTQFRKVSANQKFSGSNPDFPAKNTLRRQYLLKGTD